MGMKPRHNVFNPKRRILPAMEWTEDRGRALAAKATYGGNSEHKSRPGDYGLTPPCSPRPGKTLCDGDRAIDRAEAVDLLRRGLKRGLVSQQMRGGWPQNVWAVSADGEAFEAQLENEVQGVYHGYPMAQDDDFRSRVIDEWNNRVP